MGARRLILVLVAAVLILGMLCAGRIIAQPGPYAFAGGRPFVLPYRLGYGFGAWKLISIVSRN
jgi:hypothetical protein